MQSNSKIAVSKRVIALLLAALLALSAFSLYLIVERPSSPNINVLGYDYILSQKGNNYELQNTVNGTTKNMQRNAAAALNTALTDGNSIFVNNGTYVLNQDVLVSNKTNAKITGNDATIIANTHKITIYGDNYTDSQYNTIQGLTIINGTIRIENSFATTISDIVFENTSTGIELANTRSWSEDTQIINCHFFNATEGIAFRTPVGTATDSYESSEITGCFFNLRDNQTGILVETSADFSDSTIQDVRMWLGQNGDTNQTGLSNNGAMDQTLLTNVVFESFANIPHDLYAISLGQTSNPAPTLSAGVNFLGTWTADIHNPYGVWVPGVGNAFEKNDVNVPVGLSNQYGAPVTITMMPQTISTFTPEITVSGSFRNNETITVQVHLDFVDASESNQVEKTFSISQSIWLTNNDLLQLFPAQSVVSSVVFEAKCSSSSTDAIVTVSGYGNAE